MQQRPASDWQCRSLLSFTLPCIQFPTLRTPDTPICYLTPVDDTVDDGKLYNYEISLSRLRSPMVVLSACNSGTGTLYHGEGLMSLARGFILAGASSVIRTAWEVNDEVSADIISRFYQFSGSWQTQG